MNRVLTRSLREPGGPCTKSMEVPESRMERVNSEYNSIKFCINKKNINFHFRHVPILSNGFKLATKKVMSIMP